MCVCVSVCLFIYLCELSYVYATTTHTRIVYIDTCPPRTRPHPQTHTHTTHTHTQPESGGLLKWFNGHKKQASSPDGGPMLHLQAWILAKPNAATPQRPAPNTRGVSQAGTVSC